jgi:galactokinase
MNCINSDFTIDLQKYDIDDPTLTKRFRHFTSETARVLMFVSYLEQGDINEAFALLFESFKSLSVDYEVSIPEIDKIVDKFSALPQVIGCRMIGGGFGGSILIVSPASTGDFDLFNSYLDKLNSTMGLSAILYSLKTADGVHLI